MNSPVHSRFKPAAGVVGERNDKFMSGQFLLRGSASITPTGNGRRPVELLPPAETLGVFRNLPCIEALRLG
jgi:hypothetical protein